MKQTLIESLLWSWCMQSLKTDLNAGEGTEKVEVIRWQFILCCMDCCAPRMLKD